ncbi:hypothetical protein STEG23_026741, partial [Scotinomys teguina]
ERRKTVYWAHSSRLQPITAEKLRCDLLHLTAFLSSSKYGSKELVDSWTSRGSLQPITIG